VTDDGAELVAVAVAVAVVAAVGVAVGEVGVVEGAAIVIVDDGAESTVADVAPACSGGEPPDSSSGCFLMDRKQGGYLPLHLCPPDFIILRFAFTIFIFISERAKERWKRMEPFVCR
jgi:hypothetical protein